MAEVAYASAANLVADIFEGLLPPERVDVPTWAVRERWLNNAGGGHVGRYSHDKAPYTVWPSRGLTSLMFTTTAVVGPGQVGKTVIAENWLGHSVQTDPADFLWYMQSDDGIESYVKGTINPFIEDHDELLARRGRRPVDDSLHFKRFTGMSVEFLSFGPRTIINKSAPRIVADEVDNYQWLGDVQPVLDVRRQTFGQQSMVLALSHPDLARGMNPAEDWTSGIMAFYADSTRCTWWWPCPHCGAYSSPNPNAARYMTIHYPDDPDVPLDVVEREARLACPVNGCLIEDHHREAMNLAAYNTPGSLDGWIGDGMQISEGGEVTGELIPRQINGVWIMGSMSPFVMGGLGGLARARVKAERAFEVTGEELESPREVMVKKWGMPYSPKKSAGTIEAKDLVDRAEDALQLGVVAHGVRFLTLAVDVQAWGWDYLVRGWGVKGESWIVDQGRVATNPKTGRPVSPTTSGEDWDLLLELFDRSYPLADASGRVMTIRAMACDSGGQPGVTAQAYAAWRRWKAAGKARRLGVIAGRDVWTILLTKGAKQLEAKRLTVTFPDTATQASKAAMREVPVGMFNPNTFKDDLSGHLQTAEPGPGYVHIPAALKSKGETHIWFEQLVAEHQLPNGRWEKRRANAKNEALDLMVMAHVVAHLHGLSRIADWANPPPWCADWDQNPHVLDAAAAAEATANVVDPAAAAARIAARLASGD